jgi:hypothetical protein
VHAKHISQALGFRREILKSRSPAVQSGQPSTIAARATLTANEEETA